MEKTPRIAKKVLKPIREFGYPPQFGLELYNVGLEDELRVLEETYLLDIVRDGGSTFKFVSAGYGGGKTHFAYLFRELAWRHGFISSYVSLSPAHTQFHNLLSVFRAIVKELQRPLSDSEKEMIMEGKLSEEKGIDKLIKRWFMTEKNKFETTAADPDDAATKLKAYAKSIRDFDNLYFTKVARKSFESLLDNDSDSFENLMLWIKDDYDRNLHAEFGIKRIDDTDTFSLLRSLAVLLRDYMGYSGLIIFFDEGERHSSTSKQRDLQVSNLRQIIDACADGSMPGVMFFYTVPDENEFLNPTGQTYEALKQRLRKHFTQIHPLHPNINLEKLSPENSELVIEYLIKIGKKITELFMLAEDIKFDSRVTDNTIRNIAMAVEERLGTEVSYKRLFVQTICQALEIQRSDPNSSISRDQATDIVRDVDSKAKDSKDRNADDDAIDES